MPVLGSWEFMWEKQLPPGKKPLYVSAKTWCHLRCGSVSCLHHMVTFRCGSIPWCLILAVSLGFPLRYPFWESPSHLGMAELVVYLKRISFKGWLALRADMDTSFASVSLSLWWRLVELWEIGPSPHLGEWGPHWCSTLISWDVPLFFQAPAWSLGAMAAAHHPECWQRC